MMQFYAIFRENNRKPNDMAWFGDLRFIIIPPDA